MQASVHAIWPSGMLSLGEKNATLLQAGVNTFEFVSWNQANSECNTCIGRMAYAPFD